MFGSALATTMKSIRARQGAGHYIAHGALTAATAGALGYVQGHYREKANIPGTSISPSFAVGLAGKAAAIAGALLSKGGEPWWTNVANTIGDTGIACASFAQGVRWGTQSSGRRVYILDQGAQAPAALPAGMRQTDVIGGIPQAMGGAYMDAEQLASLARRGR